MKEKIIKGFKAFKKDMTCQGFKFKQGETYEEKKAKICEKGFHFCENPLDLLDYYDLCDSIFHEVESMGDIDKHDKDTKIATTKIRIGAKLSLSGFVNASINFIMNICKIKKGYSSQQASSGYYSKQASSGYSSQQASSGYYSKQASSGYSSQQASSGYSSQQASSGYSSKQASSGDSSQQASSGDSSQQASSGYSSKQASSGYYSKQASSGYSSKQASSGDSSKQASSGDSSKQASSGDSSQQASSGDSSKQASSGYSSQQASSGYSSQQASSGDKTEHISTGKDTVIAAIGINSKAKGIKGNWLTLAEWVYDKKKENYIPKSVKSIKIDGKKIKENVFYQLKNGKFIEV